MQILAKHDDENNLNASGDENLEGGDQDDSKVNQSAVHMLKSNNKT